ncbi:hypothetical protein Syun_014339 [Stephania yunnanensis]|uniref:Uncharacterized protein n=1 Tax=Stephania yunnanensis TaxID=152371 RepID=A0AAP0P9G2_9MAGN
MLGFCWVCTNIGLSSDSTSILISVVTTLLMLPCIAIAIRLMDISGRRSRKLRVCPQVITEFFLSGLSKSLRMTDLCLNTMRVSGVVVIDGPFFA